MQLWCHNPNCKSAGEVTYVDQELRPYLRSLAKRLRLDPSTQRSVLLELQSHLEDKAHDLQAAGVSRKEAIQRAMQYMGKPTHIAEKIYAIHSKGSWRDILLATVPHLLLAVLFALNLWTRYALLGLVLLGVAMVAIRCWRKDKPKWSYSWLGYCMAAPALSWLLATVALAYGAWTFVTTGGLPLSPALYLLILVYIPFSLWVMAWVVVPLVKQDWLMASLSALPFPFLTTWLLFFNSQGTLWGQDKVSLRETDGDRALVFLALAVTTGAFFMIGNRLLKIGLLTASTALMVAFTVVSVPVSFGILAAILIILASIAFLFSPAVLGSKLENEEEAIDFMEGGEAAPNWSHNTR